MVDWPAYEYLWLARARGLTQQAGVDLQIQRYRNTQERRQAYQTGRADAIAIDSVDLLTLCAQTPVRCPTVVVMLDQSEGGDALLAPARIANLEALSDRRVAVEPGPLGRYLVGRALEMQGLPPYRWPEFRVANFDQFPQLLRRGEVDAVATYPPTTILLQQQFTLRPLFTSAEIPGEIVDVLAIAPRWLEEHPEQVSALVRSWQAAVQLDRQEPASNGRMMAWQENISNIETFRLSQRGIRIPNCIEQYPFLSDGHLQAALERIRHTLAEQDLLPDNSPLPPIANYCNIPPEE